MPSQRNERSGGPARPDGAGVSGDLIEFLPPDERVFGPADAHTFAGVDDGTWPDDEADETTGAAARSGWVTAVAGLGVAGILAVGVVAAAPWAPDDTRTTTDTSIPATVASAPVPVAERSEPAEPARPAVPTRTGWVLDPIPDGLRGLQYLGTDGDPDRETGWGEVWAEPAASRTSGRWFSLTLLPFRRLDELGTAGFPVDVAGRDGVADVDADGVITLAVDAAVADASRVITLEAFGFTVGELVELADSIGIVDDRPQLADDRPEFLRPELLTGLERIAGARTDTGLTERVLLGNGPGTVVFYGDGRPWDLTVVQEQTDVVASDDRLLALAVDRFPVDADAYPPPPEFADADLVVGPVTVGGYELVVARWEVDGRSLSVISSRGLDATLASLSAVRFADAGEWAALEQSRAPRSPELGRLPPGTTVANGELPDGRSYAVLHWASSDELEFRIGGTSSFRPAGERPLRVLTVEGVSFVVALTSEPAARLIVTTPDGELDVGVTEFGRRATDGTARTSNLGVVALSDSAVTSFTARIVLPTGDEVAHLAPWGRGT